MTNLAINFDILNSFLQVSNWLTESLELDELLNTLVCSAVTLVKQADAGSLFLIDEAANELVLRAVYNYSPEVLGLRLKLDASVAGWVVKTRQATIVNDFASDPRIFLLPNQHNVAPIKSMLDAPLCVKDKVIGVLSFDNLNQPDAFNEEDLRIGCFFANNVAVAIERARLYESQRQQHQKLQELYHQSQQAIRLKNEFLNSATHELRTPLCIIIGFTELLLSATDEPLSERQRMWLDIIHQSSQDMLKLINDIIDLSVLHAGQMKLAPEFLSLDELLTPLLESTRRWVKDRPIEVKSFISPQLPMLYLDPKRLRQMLLGLLSNAAKFTKAGAITIEAAPIDDERWQLSVSDTGKGIAREHNELIFEEFSRVDNSSTRDSNGLGIGLAITRQLCQLMGGSIRVESAFGQGSTFTLELPLFTNLQNLA